MQDSSRLDEQRLIEQLRLGNNEAMRAFYDRYGGYLAAVCSRYVANDDDVKDVMQDAMVRLFTRITRFEYRGRGSLRSWAARIVVNESLSFLRSKHQVEFTVLDGRMADSMGEEEDLPVSDVPPDEIQRMISLLPIGYRTVFNLYVIENKSHREIAEMLGIRESASSSQLSRAKSLLAKMIQQYHQEQSQR